MVGLFENIGLAIEGAFVKARCEVANHLVDVRCRRKIKQYEKMRRNSEDEELENEEESEDYEEQETPKNNGGISNGMIARSFKSRFLQKPEHEQDNHETEGDA